MKQPATDTNGILSYALQRRALITRACEVIQELGLPVEREPDDPTVALQSLAYNWAVNVHPDLMRWYRDLAREIQAKCRYLQFEEGVDAAAGIEQLALRDLHLFTAAIDIYQALPSEIQKHLIDTASTMHHTSSIISPLRLATVVPGTLLLAWDQAWRDAIKTFGSYVGDVLQTPAAIDAFHSRIDDLEVAVDDMRSRFIAISAAIDYPTMPEQ